MILSDIMSNEFPDIAIILETFLLYSDTLYINWYWTYKTKNNIRRKGTCILVSKNILASIIVVKIDINKRHNSWQQRKNWGNSGRYLNKNQKINEKK